MSWCKRSVEAWLCVQIFGDDFQRPFTPTINGEGTSPLRPMLGARVAARVFSDYATRGTSPPPSLRLPLVTRRLNSKLLFKSVSVYVVLYRWL